MNDLPEPLVPAEVDLRVAPFPIKAIAKGFAAEFGCSVEEAEKAFREICRTNAQSADEDAIQ